MADYWIVKPLFDGRGYQIGNEVIKSVSSTDVEPIRHGFWKQISPAKVYECSECGQNVMTDDIDVYEWCHGCGAKMDYSEWLASKDR